MNYFSDGSASDISCCCEPITREALRCEGLGGRAVVSVSTILKLCLNSYRKQIVVKHAPSVRLESTGLMQARVDQIVVLHLQLFRRLRAFDHLSVEVEPESAMTLVLTREKMPFRSGRL